MTILITGANGQLGNEMRILAAQHPKHTYIFSDVIVPEDSPVAIHPLDITDEAAVCGFVGEHCVDLIVNCAAYTNVDKAEQDEATALRINADAVANLARSGARVIHVSTDYVFSGDEHLPCREDDPVAPRTAYGRTKLAGEQALLAEQPDAIIFRTAWLYSEFGNNFVKTMLRLGQTKPEIGIRLGRRPVGSVAEVDLGTRNVQERLRVAGRKRLRLGRVDYIVRNGRDKRRVLLVRPDGRKRTYLHLLTRNRCSGWGRSGARRRV